jgi:RNA polymerase sigma-70 factor (ECF subfamily)
MTRADPTTTAFESHRARLVGLGYRMLGGVAEAEDLVQETYLRWHRTPIAEIREPGAWLHTTMARLCIDELRARKTRREDYVGPWLPDPWLTAAPENDNAERQLALADDLSVAFLLLLERLAPDERAAFLLHDVFDARYPDIAAALGKTETAVRQIVTRARQRVADDRARFRTTTQEQRELAWRFQRAVLARDEPALIALFKPDATLISDGGGKARAALRPIHGADKIVRFFMGVTKGEDPNRFVQESRWINDAPGFLLREDNGVVSASAALEIVAGQITAIYLVNNPDKLTRIS